MIARRFVLPTVVLALVLAGGAAEGAPPKRCLTAAESGQQLRAQGRLVAARKTLLACTAAECPTVIRRDCARWVDELEAGTPTIVLKLEDEAGHDVSSGRVLIDGEEIEGAGSGRAIPIDPGKHSIAWMRSREEGGDIDTDIVVHEDERKRSVLLRPKPPEKIKGPDAAVQPVPPPPPRSLAAPITVGVIGGVAFATGVTLWGIGLSERSDLEDGCARTHSCSDQDVSASRTKLVVGDVLFGVSVVAAVTAAWMILRDPAPSASASR